MKINPESWLYLPEKCFFKDNFKFNLSRKLRAKEKSRDGDLKKATTELEKLKADTEKTTKVNEDVKNHRI